jgi:hypothetical protein
MTKPLPPIAMPGIQDIEAANEFLFPMMPSPGEPGYRIWADQERGEMNRRLSDHTG